MISSRAIAEWQITQLYDTDWPSDLLQAGHWKLAQNLDRFIDGGECTDMEILELRDMMVSAMMQKDS